MSKKGKEHSTVKQFSLNGHTRPVRMVRYNRDGDMFFTCSDDNLIIAWDNETAQKLGVYERKSACKSLAVSRNTEYVVGSYALEGINIFHAIDGEHLVHGKTGDGSKAQYVEFSYGDDELLVLTLNKDVSKVNIYDFKKILKIGKDSSDISKALLRSFEFESELTQASFGYLNERLYLSDNKGKMLVLDAKTGDIEVDAKVHPGFEIFSFTFSNDFSMLASCGKDNMWKLLHPDTLEIIKFFDKESPWRCASFSPIADINDSEKYHILTGGGQDARDVTTTKAKEGSFETRLFDIIYEEELAQVTGHFGPVHSIKWSPDGRSFVTASEDGTVRLQRFPLEYYE